VCWGGRHIDFILVFTIESCIRRFWKYSDLGLKCGDKSVPKWVPRAEAAAERTTRRREEARCAVLRDGCGDQPRWSKGVFFGGQQICHQKCTEQPGPESFQKGCQNPLNFIQNPSKMVPRNAPQGNLGASQFHAGQRPKGDRGKQKGMPLREKAPKRYHNGCEKHRNIDEMGPKIAPESVKNRCCIADARSERPVAPKMAPASVCAQPSGATWVILNGFWSAAGCQGHLRIHISAP